MGEPAARSVSAIPVPGLRRPSPRVATGDALPVALGVVAAVLLLSLPWPGNLLILAGAACGVTALLSPSVAIGLLLLSIPVQDYGEARLGAVHLTLTKTLIVAVAIGWAFGALTRRRPFRSSWVAGPFALYVLVVALSVVAAERVPAWSTELYRWLSPLLVYLVAVDELRDRRSVRSALIGTAIGVAAVSVYGFVQVWLGLGPPSFSVSGVTRAFGTFGQPNPFAGYLGVTVPLLVAVSGAWFAARPGARRRQEMPAWVVGLAALAGGLGLLALVLTQSRGGWLGALAGLGAVVWLLGGRVRWAAIGLAAAVAIVLVATPLGERVAARLGAEALGSGQTAEVTPENFAVQERLAHWRAGVEMVRRSPVFGVGAGNFSRAFRDATPVWRFRVPRGHAHNAYIQAAAQTGLVGLVAYLGFCGAVALRLRVLLRRAGHGPGRGLVIGAIGVTAAFAVHNLFDYLHVHSLPVQLSVVWALAEVGGDVSRVCGRGASPAGMVSA